MKNINKNWRYCKGCGKRKFLFKNFCFICFKKTNHDIYVCISDTIDVRSSLRVRHKKTGYRKFLSETLSGWFSSFNKKLKNGVYKNRVINREKNEYYEIVRDYKTGKVFHKCYEPLKVHHNKIHE